MGTFFSCGYDQQYARDFENNVIQLKVIRYITYNLDDTKWQESISHQVQEEDKYHRSFFFVVRLYRKDRIEQYNYKSNARFTKADQRLGMDVMLDLDKYLDLPEDAIRQMMCDDIFTYVEAMLIKYQKRLHNLDIEAFMPLFQQRILDIKNAVFEDNFYETSLYQRMLLADQLSKEGASDTELLNQLKANHIVENGSLPAGNKN
ncbi:hypothetical protein [Moraxella oblonga]|uniref:hypothetical protein n=1 Tax=Moraxella oblonga TaxID=200413 RepID=UPI000831564D|nr:hypothetical protein [Moraxella oblonga]